jgi:hypothetical protein
METIALILPKFLVVIAGLGAIGCLLVIPITAAQILKVAFEEDNPQELSGKGDPIQPHIPPPAVS